jgi:hypothetical protein
MAKAAHAYARCRRPPKARARFAHRRLVADRDDADSVDMITPSPAGPEQVAHPN